MMAVTEKMIKDTFMMFVDDLHLMHNKIVNEYYQKQPRK